VIRRFFASARKLAAVNIIFTPVNRSPQMIPTAAIALDQFVSSQEEKTAMPPF